MIKERKFKLFHNARVPLPRPFVSVRPRPSASFPIPSSFKSFSLFLCVSFLLNYILLYSMVFSFYIFYFKKYFSLFFLGNSSTAPLPRRGPRCRCLSLWKSYFHEGKYTNGDDQFVFIFYNEVKFCVFGCNVLLIRTFSSS